MSKTCLPMIPSDGYSTLVTLRRKGYQGRSPWLVSSMSPSLNKAAVAPVRSSDHWLHEVCCGHSSHLPAPE